MYTIIFRSKPMHWGSLQLACALPLLAASWMLAQTAATPAAQMSAPTRSIPARPLPTPDTVSQQLQKMMAAPWKGSTATMVLSTAQWKELISQRDAAGVHNAQALRQALNVTVESKTVAGVHVFSVRPPVIAPENRGRLLVHVHGGDYIFYGGEAATTEAILMAYYGKIEVLSIDYRMPPDFPYPAALDDTVAVWKEVIKTHAPKTVGFFGTSAGGGLTLATVLRLKQLHIALPGALMAGTPESDMSKNGDTYFTNERVDNILGSYDGLMEAAIHLYAGGHDLKDPLLSPVYGDLSGFPPTILLSGTRDLFLSNTVPVHQKLLLAGVRAELLVFEGESHANYLAGPSVPESVAALQEVSQFFDRTLAP